VAPEELQGRSVNLTMEVVYKQEDEKEARGTGFRIVYVVPENVFAVNLE
jgi:hypothetical protein